MDRRDGREIRDHFLLFGLMVTIFCAACVSGTAVPVSSMPSQEARAASDSLGEGGFDVRRATTEALRGLGPEAVGAVPALVQALRDAEDAGARSEIVGVLGRIGPQDGVVPALIETLLEDKDPGVRGHAAFVLGGIGPEDGVVPALIQAMENDPNMRWAVAEGLKKVGPAAAEAVPALIQTLEDECASEIEKVCDVERNAVARALRAITGQDIAEDASAWREWWEEQQQMGGSVAPSQ